MGYYPILEYAPKGRDEGEDWQVWSRRHDEYARESDAEFGAIGARDSALRKRSN
jgi:hypothetical protein